MTEPGLSESKFSQLSGMTFEQVFRFSFREFLVPLIRGLAAELEPDQFWAIRANSSSRLNASSKS